MPVLAQFTPSNAGDAVFNRTVGMLNLFDRAQQRQVEQQELEMRKQQLATTLALQDQQLDERRFALTQAQADAAVRDAERKSRIAELDGIAANHTDASQRFNELNSTIPELLKRIDAANDITEQAAIASEITSKYGFLEKNPVYGPRIQGVLGDVVSRLQAKKVAYEQRVVAVSEPFMSSLPLADVGTLNKIAASPTFSLASKNPEFVKAFAARRKELADIEAQTLKDDAALERTKELNTSRENVAEVKAAQTANKLGSSLYEGAARSTKQAEEQVAEEITIATITKDIGDLRELGRRYNQASWSGDAVEKETIRQLARQRVGSLVGSLRLPFTGPGAMTDDERKFLMDLIGNPSQIFSLSGPQFALLDSLEKKVQSDLDIKAQARGYGPRKAQRSASGTTGSLVSFGGKQYKVVGTDPVSGKTIATAADGSQIKFSANAQRP